MVTMFSQEAWLAILPALDCQPMKCANHRVHFMTLTGYGSQFFVISNFSEQPPVPPLEESWPEMHGSHRYTMKHILWSGQTESKASRLAQLLNIAIVPVSLKSSPEPPRAKPMALSSHRAQHISLLSY